MNQPPRRPSRPTRTPTSRPRRVAGQPPSVAPAEDAAEPAAQDAQHLEPAEQPEPEPVVLDKSTEPTVAGAPVVIAPEAPAYDDEPRSRRPLVALVVAIVLLVALGVAEVVYLRGDHGAGSQEVAAPSADRPVQLPELTVRSVVDQAAEAADLIISASSTDYDAQVDKAAATMTDRFAEKFRTTKADVKDEFLAAQTEVTVDISAQGVIRAGADEVQALIFLTQTTSKGSDPGVTPVQYRVTVTMVDVGGRWLVSDLQAL